MTSFLLFLLAMLTTMAFMNFYFHIKLIMGGIIHKGKIKDADNNDDGFILHIELKTGDVAKIRIGNKINENKFYKFIEKNIGNQYDIVEHPNMSEKKYIHNGSYLTKAILFSIISLLILFKIVIEIII